MPPAWAMAIAIRDSVTVSIAAREQRDVERDRRRQPRAGVGRARQHVRGARHQQDVVESESLAKFHRRLIPEPRAKARAIPRRPEKGKAPGLTPGPRCLPSGRAPGSADGLVLHARGAVRVALVLDLHLGAADRVGHGLAAAVVLAADADLLDDARLLGDDRLLGVLLGLDRRGRGRRRRRRRAAGRPRGARRTPDPRRARPPRSPAPRRRSSAPGRARGSRRACRPGGAPRSPERSRPRRGRSPARPRPG